MCFFYKAPERSQSVFYSELLFCSHTITFLLLQGNTKQITRESKKSDLFGELYDCGGMTKQKIYTGFQWKESKNGDVCVQRTLPLILCFSVSLQKLEEQDRKALNTKEQLQREHRYLKRRLEQLSVSGSVERIRTDSMGSTISTDSEQGTPALQSQPAALQQR